MTESSPIATIFNFSARLSAAGGEPPWGNRVSMIKDHIRILLIEDDEDDYVVVREMLSEPSLVDFSLEWVKTYGEGLNELRQADHDVYLLDYRLGSRTGLELIQEVMVAGCDKPIIILTGQGDYGLDMDAMRSGAADYLVKAKLTADALERSIRYSIARKKTELELKEYRNRLEDLVKERTEQLETANEKLRAEIAERKQAEEALQESEGELRGLFAAMTDVVMVLDADGVCIKIAPTSSLNLYRPAHELLGKKINEVLPKEGADKTLQQIKRALENRGTINFEYALKIGSREVWFDSKVSPLTENTVFWVARDITERKRVEEALRKTEVLLKIAMDLAKLVQWEYDVQTGMFSFDEQFYALYGTTSRDEGGPLMSVWDYARKFIPPEESHMVAEEIANTLATTDPDFSNQLEHRIIRADGDERHINVRYRVVGDQTGKVIKIRGANQDVTERKQAQEALRESEQRLSQIIDFLPDATLAIDLSGKVIAWNRAIEEMTGVKAEQMLGMGDHEYALPFYGIRRPILIDLVFTSNEDIKNKYHFVKKHGDVLWAETDLPVKGEESRALWGKARPLYDSVGSVVGAIETIRDITEYKQAQEAILRAKKDWERTFDAVPDLIAILDKDYRIARVNKAMAARLGITPAECIGLKCYQAVHGAGEPPLFCPHRQLIEDGVEHTAEIYEERLDGDFIVTVSPLFGPSHELIGSVHVGHDITERKRAEEEVKWLSRQNQLILDAAGEGIVGLDLAGRVTFINPAGAELVAYRIEELIGKDFHQTVHHSRSDGSPYPVNECPLFESLHNGVTRRESDEEFRRKDGSSFPVAYSSTPILEEGQIVGAVLTFRDITLRKLALQEMHKYRDHLEDLVEARTTELATANEQLTREVEERRRAEQALKEASEKLKFFAYSVAHDLKSPAVGVYGLTKRLREHIKDVLDEKGRIYCDQILKVSEHIAALVEKINIYIATKEAAPLIETISFSEIVQMLGDEFSAQFSLRRIDLIVPESGVEIKADRLSILRVFRNLIDNALKYGGETLSWISIGYEDSETLHIFSVSDNGKGIKGADAEKIFGLFQRNETSRGVEGAGLGLAIVKEIAEQHGGRVWVELRGEKGITFCVSISKNL